MIIVCESGGLVVVQLLIDNDFKVNLMNVKVRSSEIPSRYDTGIRDCGRRSSILMQKSSKSMEIGMVQQWHVEIIVIKSSNYYWIDFQNISKELLVLTPYC